MASLDIKSITNSELRKFAEHADAQGSNAYNGKLDSNELSVFMDEAAKSSIKKTEILAIVNEVGVNNEDTKTSEKIELLKMIDNTEKTLKQKENKLKNKESEYNKTKPMTIARTAGRVGGGLVCGGIGGWAAADMAAAALGVAATGPIGLTVAAVIGGICAIGGGLYFGEMSDAIFGKTYDEK